VSRELLLSNYERYYQTGYRQYLKEMEQIYGMQTPKNAEA
jgi:hypothetical protein